jgi:hypothetical protein
MIGNWKEQIAVGWLVKQAMMETDIEKIFPYHLPKVAAGKAEIDEAERALGQPLDERYKEFLRNANGWPAFWHSADLFGTQDLIGGERKNAGEFLLSMLPDSVLSQNNLNRADLLPICATKLDKDIFVLGRPCSPSPGIVVWFAGEEVERFPTFDDFFLAMVEYAKQDVEWLKRRRAK